MQYSVVSMSAATTSDSCSVTMVVIQGEEEEEEYTIHNHQCMDFTCIILCELS